MKKLCRVSIAALLISAFFSTTGHLFAADAAPPAKKVGSALTLTNRDIELAARAWQRIFGETVTIADRAKSRRVSVEISAPKDQFRTLLVDALRQNGVYVIKRTDGVLFDTEPESAPSLKS